MAEENPYNAPAADLSPQSEDRLFELADRPRSNSIGHGWSWIREGFGYFGRSWLAWVLAMLLGFAIMMVLSLIPFINVIFQMLTTYVWIGGIVLGCHAQSQGEDFRVSHLWAGFSNRLGSLILLTLVYNLGIILIVFAAFVPLAPGMLSGDMQSLPTDNRMLVIGMLIALLFVIPLSMAVFFAPHLIVLNEVPLFRAMKLSFIGCLKNVLPFLWWSIVMTVLFLVASIPVGLGLLVVVPVAFASCYVAYENIFLRN